MIIFQRAKISTQSITYLCWCNWRTFWRKNATGQEGHQGSCSCTTMPWRTGYLQPRRNWPTWASNVLITYPILPVWPHWTIICSLDWKNNWKVAIFRPTRRLLLPRRPAWMDNVLNFFLSGLQKLVQGAKKCIELRGVFKGEYLFRNTTNSEPMVYSVIWNYMFRSLLAIFRFLQFFKSSLYML